LLPELSAAKADDLDRLMRFYVAHAEEDFAKEVGSHLRNREDALRKLER
jgi:hypothetical protein